MDCGKCVARSEAPGAVFGRGGGRAFGVKRGDLFPAGVFS